VCIGYYRMASPRLTLRQLGLLAFAATTLPLAISAHLAGEVAGLGDRSGFGVVFSGRHAYFAVIGLAVLLAFRAIARSAGGSGGAIRLEAVVRALPFGGQGARFAALAFAVQLAFFGLTQIAEGCPLSGGDVALGVITAILVAAIGSLLLALCERRLLACVLLFFWLTARPLAPSLRRRLRAKVPRFAVGRGAFLFSIASRPPPITRVA
jgi:hypothetical protein